MFYTAAYDTESNRCINGVRSLVKQHKKYKAPATFFIVGELLEDTAWAEEMSELMNDPLFEVASHSYTHLLIKESKCYNNIKPSLSKIEDEIKRTNDKIEEVFGKRPLGFRTPSGFAEGLHGEPEIIEMLWNNGIRYVSSVLMGRGDTVPAPISKPFWYDTESVRCLLCPVMELPGHDWHENVLKGYNFCPIAWPPTHPWGYPQSPPQNANEEFAVFKMGLDYVKENNLPYYSPIMHPWSVYRFNKDAETIGLLLEYAGKIGIKYSNMEQLYKLLNSLMPI